MNGTSSSRTSRRGNRMALFLVRAVMALLAVSTLVNVFYFFQLPHPTHHLLHQLVVSGGGASPVAEALRQYEDKMVHQLLQVEEEAVKELESLTGVMEEEEDTQDAVLLVPRLPPPKSPYLVKDVHNWMFLDGVESKQVVKTDKHGNPINHNIHEVHQADLLSVLGHDHAHDESLTMEQASLGREPLLQILRDAGVTEMDAPSIAMLPTWQQVVELYGDGPVVYGLDTCSRFRETIPADDASIGTAGLFNTGTNPFAMYLAANCVMPNNTHDRGHGMRWQVPWGKHMLASRKWENTANHDYHVNKTNVLPVALIRDPYSWMQSMCRHPYAARWVHNEHHCPDLVPTEHDFEHHLVELYNAAESKNHTSVPVTIGYPHRNAEFPSLAHVWSQWYNEYKQADYPRLIVRFEDLIFHPKQMVSTVCACAGAVPKQDAFLYVVGEGKWGSKVHDGSSNLVTAMIRYGSDAKRLSSLTTEDLAFARQHLDPELMHMFQYRQPYNTVGERPYVP